MVRYLEEYVGGSYAGRIVGRCSVVVEICVLLITATEISTLRRTRGPSRGRSVSADKGTRLRLVPTTLYRHFLAPASPHYECP